MFCPPKRQFLFDRLTQTVLQQSSFLEGDATNYIYVIFKDLVAQIGLMSLN